MRGTTYQIALIASGIAATALFGVFLYRELFPEYRIYQNDYLALEKFRSTYSGTPPPQFKEEVKQIVIEREDKGPPVVDRCISCHVALQFSAFSPTKIARDQKGNVLLDQKGIPLQIPNEEYVWERLNNKISSLIDPAVLKQLEAEGEWSEIASRRRQAKELSELKIARVDGQTYDVTKVLAMHPLIGKETRPFEYHSLEEYGCVSCHNGNGRALTTNKAHGPVFDEQYEVEFMGPKPQFLDLDPANDPLFAKMFNDKPGHALLFQTNPIFIGSLIEAKCVQCHIPEASSRPENATIDLLTQHYQHGKQLYISQACYACHRIAGFARGGVGPELSRIGNSYPWYIKESIVWPQADLKTSTMPNYRLDHEELQDLMAFLLAQVGQNKATSPIDYKSDIQQWEAGKKNKWEEAISPSQERDLRFGMTLFATEGCAACHRLEGFTSNVGFRIEKEGKATDFASLYQEHLWFQNLFPETITGPDIAHAIDLYKEEINQHIDTHVRDDSILEEIETQFPGILETFYSNFKYASRAKNSYYAHLMETAQDPHTKAVIQEEQETWKQSVNMIRMLFIQEYGLGRLVCPRPNWSGVYRSDEWLMEHFHNPAAHVPRSIMPVFPFDDTKFYALTRMLDTLSSKNRNSTQAIWKENGFNPELAFQIHCAQCHGEYLSGNGPVSDWIYPIPKNLRNGEFLRNLGKERVIQSITHGVKGTPMPPWGEVPPEKAAAGESAVLTAQQISILANWLFSNIPGEAVIRDTNDLPKWEYTPQKIEQELEEEGNKLKPETENSTAFFDARTPPVPGPDRVGYYIKRQYYTQENLQRGKEFFDLNCAACHGSEADGAGPRAAYMQEAKPRMLINLDWINTRDDLRLLRSIKYGVPGTAMTPWGDLTTALQRLQLVMFIRSLTEERGQREKLLSLLYQTFSPNQLAIGAARANAYKKLEEVRSRYTQLQDQREALLLKIKSGSSPDPTLSTLYQQELEQLIQVQQLEGVDHLFIKLENTLDKEESLYQALGLELLASQVKPVLFDRYLELIKLNSNRYHLQNGSLELQLPASLKEQVESAAAELLYTFSQATEELSKQKQLAEAQLSSKERTEKISHLTAKIASYKRLSDRVAKTNRELSSLLDEELVIFKQLPNVIGSQPN